MSNWKGDGRDSLLVRCRDEIERRNAAWAGWAASYPRIVLIATLVFTIAAALGLGRLRIETSPESLLKLDDPARVEQANLRALFGTTERVLLLIRMALRMIGSFFFGSPKTRATSSLVGVRPSSSLSRAVARRHLLSSSTM